MHHAGLVRGGGRKAFASRVHSACNDGLWMSGVSDSPVSCPPPGSVPQIIVRFRESSGGRHDRCEPRRTTDGTTRLATCVWERPSVGAGLVDVLPILLTPRRRPFCRSAWVRVVVGVGGHGLR